jgi:hypothetical protein
VSPRAPNIGTYLDCESRMRKHIVSARRGSWLQLQLRHDFSG